MLVRQGQYGTCQSSVLLIIAASRHLIYRRTVLDNRYLACIAALRNSERSDEQDRHSGATHLESTAPTMSLTSHSSGVRFTPFLAYSSASSSCTP